jgi:hypothetical protein
MPALVTPVVPALPTAPRAAPIASDAERSKALFAALAQIDKQFGKGSIMRLGDGASVEAIEVVSTGSLGLDIALGVGGLPRGRVDILPRLKSGDSYGAHPGIEPA